VSETRQDGHGPMGWANRVEVHPTAFVAPGAVVVGDVTLGARSGVWFNAVLRGDIDRIVVGEDSNVQDGSVVHADEGSPSLVGARVTIGHGAVIHGCTIEDDALVGMGAIVLTGARVGAGSLVGAGALVRERQVIPPGGIALGMPAKVVGQVTDEHRAGMRRGCEHYVALARSYLERGFGQPLPATTATSGLTGHARGPMTFLEWDRLLAVLAEGPDRVAERMGRHDDAAWRRRPGAGRWSALEALCHLRDVDREVFGPRLERLLSGPHPELPDVTTRGWDAARDYQAQSPARALEEWRAARRVVRARLAPLSRGDWDRVGFHPARGAQSVAAMVRAWAEHDLSHRRQMADALGEFS
jgi:carbonic anhydrase/acetyltransferase-like protein (isoleucine patch superfamily)